MSSKVEEIKRRQQQNLIDQANEVNKLKLKKQLELLKDREELITHYSNSILGNKTEDDNAQLQDLNKLISVNKQVILETQNNLAINNGPTNTNDLAGGIKQTGFNGISVIGTSNAIKLADKKKLLFGNSQNPNLPSMPNVTNLSYPVNNNFNSSSPNETKSASELERDRRLRERALQRQQELASKKESNTEDGSKQNIFSSNNSSNFPSFQPNSSNVSENYSSISNETTVKSRRDQIWEEKKKKFVELNNPVPPNGGDSSNGNFSNDNYRDYSNSDFSKSSLSPVNDPYAKYNNIGNQNNSKINTYSYDKKNDIEDSYQPIQSPNNFNTQPSKKQEYAFALQSQMNEKEVDIRSNNNEYNGLNIGMSDRDNIAARKKQEYALALQAQMKEKESINSNKASVAAVSFSDLLGSEKNRDKKLYALELEAQIREKDARKYQAPMVSPPTGYNNNQDNNAPAGFNNSQDNNARKKQDYAYDLKEQMRIKEEKKALEKRNKLAEGQNMNINPLFPANNSQIYNQLSNIQQVPLINNPPQYPPLNNQYASINNQYPPQYPPTNNFQQYQLVNNPSYSISSVPQYNNNAIPFNQYSNSQDFAPRGSPPPMNYQAYADNNVQSQNFQPSQNANLVYNNFNQNYNPNFNNNPSNIGVNPYANHSNPYQNNDKAFIELQKKKQYQLDLQLQIAEKEAKKAAEKQKMEAYNLSKEREMMGNNPFGKPGAGAPPLKYQQECNNNSDNNFQPQNIHIESINNGDNNSSFQPPKQVFVPVQEGQARAFNSKINYDPQIQEDMQRKALKDKAYKDELQLQIKAKEDAKKAAARQRELEELAYELKSKAEFDQEKNNQLIEKLKEQSNNQDSNIEDANVGNDQFNRKLTFKEKQALLGKNKLIDIPIPAIVEENINSRLEPERPIGVGNSKKNLADERPLGITKVKEVEQVADIDESSKYNPPIDRKMTFREKQRLLGYDKSNDAPELVSPPPPDVSARSQLTARNYFDDAPIPSSKAKVNNTRLLSEKSASDNEDNDDGFEVKHSENFTNRQNSNSYFNEVNDIQGFNNYPSNTNTNEFNQIHNASINQQFVVPRRPDSRQKIFLSQTPDFPPLTKIPSFSQNIQALNSSLQLLPSSSTFAEITSPSLSPFSKRDSSFFSDYTLVHDKSLIDSLETKSSIYSNLQKSDKASKNYNQKQNYNDFNNALQKLKLDLENEQNNLKKKLQTEKDIETIKENPVLFEDYSRPSTTASTIDPYIINKILNRPNSNSGFISRPSSSSSSIQSARRPYTPSDTFSNFNDSTSRLKTPRDTLRNAGKSFMKVDDSVNFLTRMKANNDHLHMKIPNKGYHLNQSSHVPEVELIQPNSFKFRVQTPNTRPSSQISNHSIDIPPYSFRVNNSDNNKHINDFISLEDIAESRPTTGLSTKSFDLDSFNNKAELRLKQLTELNTKHMDDASNDLQDVISAYLNEKGLLKNDAQTKIKNKLPESPSLISKSKWLK